LIWRYEEKLDTKNLAKWNALKMPGAPSKAIDKKKEIEA